MATQKILEAFPPAPTREKKTRLELIQEADGGMSFNAHMTAKLLSLQKSETRRPIEDLKLLQAHHIEMCCNHPEDEGCVGWLSGSNNGIVRDEDGHGIGTVGAPYDVGQLIYVREPWAFAVDPLQYIYGADEILAGAADIQLETDYNKDAAKTTYHTPHWMPSDAARIFIRIENIWAERLKDISNCGAMSEGFQSEEEFIRSFLDIYTPRRWDNCYADNPFVWVYDFIVVEVF
ncbi:MAG: hypothetical protein LBQ80_02000 [Clostridium sp.]|jgi:hypothetical protein|nr:hypothetical protein [Clostridium sp.]